MKYQFTIITRPNDYGRPDRQVPLHDAKEHLEGILRAFNILVESVEAEAMYEDDDEKSS